MAIEVGLLTCGSSYSPTPSQPFHGQWPALLAFVPAYSGASVRELHPLPVSLISIARIAIRCGEVSPGATNVKYFVPHHDQATGAAMVISHVRADVIVWVRGSTVERDDTMPKPAQIFTVLQTPPAALSLG